MMTPVPTPFDPRLGRRPQSTVSATQRPRDEEERALMAQLEAMQQAKAPNAVIKKLNTPEALAQQEAFAKSMRDINANTQMTVQAPKAGLLDRIGAFVGDRVRDPATMAQLAATFNAMSLNQSPQFQAGMMGRATRINQGRETARKEDEAKRQNNMTVDMLRKMGRDDLAALVEANPALAGEIIKIMFDPKSTHALKGFAPQVDPATGQIFGISYNPNTNSYERVNVPGARGETPSEKDQRTIGVDVIAADIQKAMSAGQEAMSQYQTVTDSIRNYEDALSAVRANPNATGPINQLLPNLTADAVKFEQAAARLGINVINEVTFGALSEKELDLALRTSIDPSLPDPQQIARLEEVLVARRKLAAELYKKASALSGGQMRYSEWIESLGSNSVQRSSTTSAPTRYTYTPGGTLTRTP